MADDVAIRTEHTLGQLGEFRNGANFSQKDYGPGFPIVNVKQLYRGRYASMDDLHELYSDAVSKPESLFLRYGDILFARSSVKASGAGQVAMVGPCRRNAVFSGFIIRFRVSDTDQLSPEYLNYVLRSPIYRELLTRIASGTTITNLSQDALARLPIEIPHPAEQKAIAGVLGALDDKIELNRRMNATLEAMARALFRSWFVDFDPVRAKLDGRQPAGLDAATAGLFPDSFHDSELGHLPKGWTAGTIGDVGSNPRRSIKPHEIAPNTPYIALQHMPRRSVSLDSWEESANVESGKSEFNKGEILFGKLRPYFHKVGVAPLDGVCSTDILVIVPKSPEWFGFLLGHVSSDELIQFTDLASTGTKMPRTNWGDISSFKVAIPSESVATAYSRATEPMVNRVLANIHQSRTLAALRDTLLPKLLCGEVRVADHLHRSMSHA